MWTGFPEHLVCGMLALSNQNSIILPIDLITSNIEPMSAEKSKTAEQTMAVERQPEQIVVRQEMPVMEKIADSDPAAEAARRILGSRRIEAVREELSQVADAQLDSTVIPVGFERAATFVLRVGEKAEQKKRSAGTVKRFILLALAALGIHGGDLKAQVTAELVKGTNTNGSVEKKVTQPGMTTRPFSDFNNMRRIENQTTGTNTVSGVDKRAVQPVMTTEPFSNWNNMRGVTDAKTGSALNDAPQTAPGNYYARPNLNEQNRQQSGTVQKEIPAILDPVGAFARWAKKKNPNVYVSDYEQPVGPVLEYRDTGASISGNIEAAVPGKPILKGVITKTNFESGFDKKNKDQFYIRP